MRITFVINALRGGGAERVLVMLANYLCINGYIITIIIFTNDKPFYELNPAIKLISINLKIKNKNILSKINFYLKRLFILRKIFIQNKTDLVIGFMTGTNVFTTIAAKLAFKKVIISEHTNYHRNERGFDGITRRLIYPLSDELVVLTNYDKNKYTYVKNITVIQNPLVLTNNFLDIERKNIILGVGSLINVKGFDMLINAFGILNNKDWQLIIVGEGSERDKLEKLISTLNLVGRVLLPGQTKDIERYYKEASIFVLSSRAEGFPGVLCEAMGYGCPAIAFDCLTGPREIIQNRDRGILVQSNNIELLVYELGNLITNESLRKDISLNAQAIKKELDIKVIAKSWINIFNKYR
jgi:GalNAc-alpha-(1->4)-GalNAc-alpha-(1->3)-diNAcBac-PP-undecaprenol alpha-1,4-N-acetyl-D-galactosaminyltransferase